MGLYYHGIMGRSRSSWRLSLDHHSDPDVFYDLIRLLQVDTNKQGSLTMEMKQPPLTIKWDFQAGIPEICPVDPAMPCTPIERCTSRWIGNPIS